MIKSLIDEKKIVMKKKENCDEKNIAMKKICDEKHFVKKKKILNNFFF